MAPVKARPAGLRESDILAPILRSAHSVWLRETNRFLLPIVLREASFWDRWPAVRYLADQFLAQYRRERSLLEELRAFLPPETAERLSRSGDRIAELQRELDDMGRRRGTAHRASVAGRELVDSLRAWCSDLEEAAGQIPLELLTPEGSRLIAELDLYTRAES